MKQNKNNNLKKDIEKSKISVLFTKSEIENFVTGNDDDKKKFKNN